MASMVLVPTVSAERWAMVATVILLSGAFDAEAGDLDSDGIRDYRDNCLLRANPRQLDPDQDGYGNRCDGDFDQDGDVDQDDYDYFTNPSCFPPNCVCEVCDITEDGILNIYDIAAFSGLVGRPPGPSGLDCAGTVPCVAEAPALSGALRGGLVLALIATASALRRRYRCALDAAGGRMRADRGSPLPR